MPTRTKLTRQQITGFWGAWAGWTLDGMDSGTSTGSTRCHPSVSKREHLPRRCRNLQYRTVPALALALHHREDQ